MVPSAAACLPTLRRLSLGSVSVIYQAPEGFEGGHPLNAASVLQKTCLVSEVCFCLQLLGFSLCSTQALIPLTKGRTLIPCIAGQIPNRSATREVPGLCFQPCF